MTSKADARRWLAAELKTIAAWKCTETARIAQVVGAKRQAAKERAARMARGEVVPRASKAKARKRKPPKRTVKASKASKASKAKTRQRRGKRKASRKKKR